MHHCPSNLGTANPNMLFLWRLSVFPIRAAVSAQSVTPVYQAHQPPTEGTPLSRNDLPRPRFSKTYGFAIVTGLLFLLSWAEQFVSQLIEVRNEASQHQEAFTWSDFWPQFFSSTFENWQSEFLQLVWQAVGLSFLLYWGSSQSKESDERIEEKLDALLAERGIDPQEVSRRVNGSL